MVVYWNHACNTHPKWRIYIHVINLTMVAAHRIATSGTRMVNCFVLCFLLLQPYFVNPSCPDLSKLTQNEPRSHRRHCSDWGRSWHEVLASFVVTSYRELLSCDVPRLMLTDYSSLSSHPGDACGTDQRYASQVWETALGPRCPYVTPSCQEYSSLTSQIQYHSHLSWKSSLVPMHASDFFSLSSYLICRHFSHWQNFLPGHIFLAHFLTFLVLNGWTNVPKTRFLFPNFVVDFFRRTHVLFSAQRLSSFFFHPYFPCSCLSIEKRTKILFFHLSWYLFSPFSH